MISARWQTHYDNHMLPSSVHCSLLRHMGCDTGQRSSPAPACKLCVWWTTVARLLCLTKHLPWKLSEETTYGPNDCLGQLREIIFQRSETDFVFSSVKDVKSKLCLIIFRYQVLSRGPSKIFFDNKAGRRRAAVGLYWHRMCYIVTLLHSPALVLWCEMVERPSCYIAGTLSQHQQATSASVGGNCTNYPTH